MIVWLSVCCTGCGPAVYWLIGPQLKPPPATTTTASLTQTAVMPSSRSRVVQSGGVKGSGGMKGRRGRPLRAGLVCWRCRRVVTTLSSLITHQRTAHHQLGLRRAHHGGMKLGLTHQSTVRCPRPARHRLFTDSTRLEQHQQLHRATVRPTSTKPTTQL